MQTQTLPPICLESCAYEPLKNQWCWTFNLDIFINPNTFTRNIFGYYSEYFHPFGYVNHLKKNWETIPTDWRYYFAKFHFFQRSFSTWNSSNINKNIVLLFALGDYHNAEYANIWCVFNMALISANKMKKKTSQSSRVVCWKKWIAIRCVAKLAFSVTSVK